MEETVTPAVTETPTIPESTRKPRKSRKASSFLLLTAEQVNAFLRAKDLEDARSIVANLQDGTYYRVCVREQIVKETPKPVEPKATVVVRRPR
jgi:hypothetical protein